MMRLPIVPLLSVLSLFTLILAGPVLGMPEGKRIGADQLLGSTKACASQDTFKLVADSTLVELALVESMPVFPGGDPALWKFLGENLQYPDSCMKNGIEGTVYLSYVVNRIGQVQQVEVLKGVDPLIDAEAVRVLKMLPNWSPAVQWGARVPVRMKIPIRFRLGP